MKRNIFYLSVLVVIISFILSTKIVDKISFERSYYAFYAYNDKNSESVVITIENSEKINNIDNKQFFSSLDQCAVNNDLIIHALVYNTSGSNDYNLYISSNDTAVQENLMLKKGYAKNSEKYSNYADDTDHQILQFGNIVLYSVEPLANCNKKSAFLTVISTDGNVVGKTKEMLNDFAGIYGEINVKSPMASSITKMSENELTIILSSFNDISLKFGLSIVLIVLLCSKIFAYTKRIALMKIEGDSSFEIYYALFLRDYGLMQIIAYAVFICISYLIYGSNFNSFKIINEVMFVEMIQMVLLIVLVSFIIYMVIKYIPITLEVKGHNNLNEVWKVAYIIKIIIITIILSSIVTTIDNSYKLLKMTIRKDNVIDSLDNQYVFGTLKSSLEYDMDIGKENYIRLKEYLADNNILFEQSKAYFMVNNQLREQYYAVDELYLKNNDLLDECNVEHICIFTNQYHDVDALIENTKKMVNKEYEIDIIDKKIDLPSYNFSDLILQDNIQSSPLIYLPVEDNLKGQLNSCILIYDGDFQEVQNYIDDVFYQFGYVPAFNMSSRQEMFKMYYLVYKNNYQQQFLFLLVMILAYIFANRLLVEIDIENNAKRYIIANYEGIDPYPLFIYIQKMASPGIIALAINVILFRNFSIRDLLIKILFIIIMELLLYILFIFKYVKEVEHGNLYK